MGQFEVLQRQTARSVTLQLQLGSYLFFLGVKIKENKENGGIFSYGIKIYAENHANKTNTVQTNVLLWKSNANYPTKN